MLKNIFKRFVLSLLICCFGCHSKRESANLENKASAPSEDSVLVSSFLRSFPADSSRLAFYEEQMSAYHTGFSKLKTYWGRKLNNGTEIYFLNFPRKPSQDDYRDSYFFFIKQGDKKLIFHPALDSLIPALHQPAGFSLPKDFDQFNLGYEDKEYLLLLFSNITWRGQRMMEILNIPLCYRYFLNFKDIDNIRESADVVKFNAWLNDSIHFCPIIYPEKDDIISFWSYVNNVDGIWGVSYASAFPSLKAEYDRHAKDNSYYSDFILRAQNDRKKSAKQYLTEMYDGVKKQGCTFFYSKPDFAVYKVWREKNDTIIQIHIRQLTNDKPFHDYLFLPESSF